MKTNPGRFFEDYQLDMVLAHATPRTIGPGDLALNNAIYPNRFALHSSRVFAQNCGLSGDEIDPLIAFHVVFGKSVPDVSINAVANLGYADGRWLAPVMVGDTLSASSRVIGLKENSNGETGIVYVETSGFNQTGARVLTYKRWVMVKKRDVNAPAPRPVVPAMPDHVAAADLVIPPGLTFANYDEAAAGAPYRVSDYTVGEVIDHVEGVTLDETEHMMATRLWQNTAKVHFDVTQRPDGRRLIYGGHIISLARALSFNGLQNAQMMVGLNAGSHVNPAFAGDTLRAWSHVLDRAEIAPGIGALRLRLVATKAGDAPEKAGELRDETGKYLPHILLDLDYWALIPA